MRIRPGNNGSSSSPGITFINSCNTLMGSNLFGCEVKRSNCVSPGFAVFDSLKQICACRPSRDKVRSIRLMKTRGWSRCHVNSPRRASPQKPTSITAFVTRSRVFEEVSLSERFATSARVKPARILRSCLTSVFFQDFRSSRMRLELTSGKISSCSTCHILSPVR